MSSPRNTDSHTRSGSSGGTPSEVEAAFRAEVTSCACPACGHAFTDAAVDWGKAWREGYVDAVHDGGWMIRDGPFKLRCEGCQARSWYSVLGRRVELAAE